jgi:hypothetical protein
MNSVNSVAQNSLYFCPESKYFTVKYVLCAFAECLAIEFCGHPYGDPCLLIFFVLSYVSTVIARISVTFSTLHSFISVKKMFDEHVYLTQNAHEP